MQMLRLELCPVFTVQQIVFLTMLSIELCAEGQYDLVRDVSPHGRMYTNDFSACQPAVHNESK